MLLSLICLIDCQDQDFSKCGRTKSSDSEVSWSKGNKMVNAELLLIVFRS